MFNFQSVRSSVDSIKKRLQEIVTETRDADLRQDQLTRLPPCRAELQALVSQWVDERAKQPLHIPRLWLERAYAQGGAEPVFPDAKWKPLSNFSLFFDVAGDLDRMALEIALCAANGEGVKQMLFAQIDQMGWEDGPSLSKRQTEYAQLTKKLVALREERERILTEATNAGISVDGLA